MSDSFFQDGCHYWTVGNIKGGTGKSTTAVMLALALAQATNQRICLIDADPSNDNAFQWSELAGTLWPANVVVQRWASLHLAKRVHDSADTFDHLIIDTGPTDTGIFMQALTVTQRLILPMSPSSNDLLQLNKSLVAAAQIGAHRNDLDLAILLVRVRAGTNSRTEIREAIEQRGLPVLATEIPLKEGYAGAAGTVPKNFGEYGPLLTELIKRPVRDLSPVVADQEDR